MRDFIWVIPALLLAFYVGEVLGLHMQCNSMKQLKYVRGYTLYIPFLVIKFLLHLIFSPNVPNRLSLLFCYIFKIKNKNLVMASILSMTIQEYLLKHPEASVGKTKKVIRYVNSEAFNERAMNTMELAYA